MSEHRPDFQEIPYGDLRVGDVILPWDGEVEVTGTWTVTLVGPVPLHPKKMEYQTDRTPYWTSRDTDLPVRIRRRYGPDELDVLTGNPLLLRAPNMG